MLGIFAINILRSLLPLKKEKIKILHVRDGITFVDKNPKDVHIFFDAHSVLIERTPWAFIKNGTSNLFATKETLKEKVYLAGQFAQVFCDIRFYKELKILLKDSKGKSKITESYFNMIGNLGYQDVKEALVQFANNIFVTNKALLPLLAELKERQYNLHLFSNIGASVFKDAQDRNLFPELFGENGYFTENSINKKTPTNGIYQTWKPQPEAYQEALDNTGATADNSIMIDDKLKNLPTILGIKAALKKKTPTKQTQQWGAGIVYENQNEAEDAFKELGLI